MEAAARLVGLLLLLHTFGAWANVKVEMEDRVEVFRGATAQISCLYESPEGTGGTIIEWLYLTRSAERRSIYYQDASMHRFLPGTPFTDRISVNSSSATQLTLTIDSVRLEDELVYICRITTLTHTEHGEGSTRLKVFATPDRPTIEGTVTGISTTEDKPKIATCEVRNSFPRPNITWYRNKTPLQVSSNVSISHRTTSESSGLYSVTSELRMRVTKEVKNDFFYCEVSYFVPGETRMMDSLLINVTVLYPSTAVSIWVESPKGKIKEGDRVELHCQGNGNMPSSFTIMHEMSGESWDTNMKVLQDVKVQNQGVYSCSSLDYETSEEVRGNTTLEIHFLRDAVVIPEDSTVVPYKEKLEASCNAVSSLATQTVWLKDKKAISREHMLVVDGMTYDKAGTYVCVISAPEIEGMETSATLLVHVQGPPEIMQPNVTEMEDFLESDVDLTCNVRGFPEPTVTWTSSDGKVLKAATQKQTEQGVQSTLKFKIVSDSTVVCNASNAHGANTVTFNIKATTYTTTAAKTTTTTTTTVLPTKGLPPKVPRKEGRGVIIAVVIICILLLAILGSVLYFLYKKGKICGRSGKQEFTKEKSNKDNTVVEMKRDNTEEAVLLGVNGEKQPPSD
ncbi:melanoma cell adhesion molecule b isoform X2 [Nelusetta ayraudi]|uniref:melanoma cell adhesion molecule b isoform X2 n=1 Tax=Nelusetta ayraudi TaxID=303726 RepID=UPI003F6F4997